MLSAGADIHIRAEPCRSLLSRSAVSSPWPDPVWPYRVYSMITIQLLSSSSSVSFAGSVMGKSKLLEMLSNGKVSEMVIPRMKNECWIR